MEVKRISLTDERQVSFALQVTLQSPDGDGDEVDESDKIQDFSVFRTLERWKEAISRLLDGFYALRRSE
jgi:hypothetical protein